MQPLLVMKIYLCLGKKELICWQSATIMRNLWSWSGEIITEVDMRFALLLNVIWSDWLLFLRSSSFELREPVFLRQNFNCRQLEYNSPSHLDFIWIILLKWRKHQLILTDSFENIIKCGYSEGKVYVTAKPWNKGVRVRPHPLI